MPPKKPLPYTFHMRKYLVGMLKERELERLAKMRTRLADQAKELVPSAIGFFYRGNRFKPESGVIHPRDHLTTLPAQFRSEADLIIQQTKMLDEDLETIGRGLGVLLLTAKNAQDVRNALYEGLVELAPDLKQLPRTKPEMFLLPENSTAREQYLEVRPLIEQYCVMRMIS